MSENLKNMLLVMANGGYLAPPDENPEQEELWNETWKRINRFLPNLHAELFPEEAKKPKAERRSKEKENAKPKHDDTKETKDGEKEEEEKETEKSEA